jgi:hypothetical protein
MLSALDEPEPAAPSCVPPEAGLEARLAAVLPADADPRLRAIGELWLAIRPEPARLPGRRHFDPLCIEPRVLPYLWLLDVEREPRLRFRYRLLGTAHALAMGGDFTGEYLDIAHPAFLESASRADYISVAAGYPSYRRGKPTFHMDKSYLAMERLALPLAADGERVNMLLAITVYARVEPAPAAEPVLERDPIKLNRIKL